MEMEMESLVRDQISELPEKVLHQILSLLETDEATRMATLSKKWRSVWNSFPYILDFDESNFWERLRPAHRYLMRRKFIDYVDNSLRRCRRRPKNIQEFRLSVIEKSVADIDLFSHIDHWIRFVMENKVEKLVLYIPGEKHYKLPQIVFESKSITVLELEGCKLEPTRDIKLCSLKKLSLQQILVEQEVIQHLISSCPLLEKLSLKYSYGWKHLQFSSPRLEILRVKYVSRLTGVTLDAPNLRSVCFQYGQLREPCEINAVGLKTLALQNMNIKDKVFEGLISERPYLENLNLVNCFGLGRLEISHQLKSLELSGCKDLTSVEIFMAT